MIYILVCARVRDSAWGMERGGGGGGGGRKLVPEGGISYEWGGRPPPPEPMLDPGLRGIGRDLTFIKANCPWLGVNNRSNVVV